MTAYAWWSIKVAYETSARVSVLGLLASSSSISLSYSIIASLSSFSCVCSARFLILSQCQQSSSVRIFGALVHVWFVPCYLGEMYWINNAAVLGGNISGVGGALYKYVHSFSRQGAWLYMWGFQNGPEVSEIAFVLSEELNLLFNFFLKRKVLISDS